MPWRTIAAFIGIGLAVLVAYMPDTRMDIRPVVTIPQAKPELDTNAQTKLGDSYWQGLGVARNGIEAVAWFRKAAQDTGEAGKLAKQNLKILGVPTTF